LFKSVIMHRQLVLVFLLAPAVLTANICNSGNCDLNTGCVCASTLSPMSMRDTPQFVHLTFDDQLTSSVYQKYLSLFEGRTNPDGHIITATFFVSHEYTDYEIVNKLYNTGHEIASNSFTSNYSVEYWRELSLNDMISEYWGQKQAISRFANIPITAVKGARMPMLEMVGDKTIETYVQCGIQYDSSWPSPSKDMLFPYTLDYKSPQKCSIGSCPESSFPGFFIHPINSLRNQDGHDCNNLMGCNVRGSANDVYNWIRREFYRQYQSNRSPFKLLINSGWFTQSKQNYDGLVLFLNHLDTLNDVFIVSESRAIEWRKKPISSQNFSSFTQPSSSAPCVPVNCELNKGNEKRIMRSCSECPAVYPSLYNPLGINYGCDA